MNFLRLLLVVALGLLVLACKQAAETPVSAPVSPPDASWLAERAGLERQVATLDAEAEQVTRELVKVKVERDQLKRELHELTKRPGCAPVAAR